jgi:hypothetical protein
MAQPGLFVKWSTEMAVKISGTDGIDVAQLRAPDGDPVAVTISNAGVVAFPQTPSNLSAIVLSAPKTAGQTVNTATDTELSGYATPTVDSVSGFNVTTGRYTPNKAGWYSVTAQIRYTVAISANAITCGIRKNGAAVKENAHGSSNWAQYFDTTALVYLNGTTDYVSVWTYQNRGSSITGVLGRLDVTYVGS